MLQLVQRLGLDLADAFLGRGGLPTRSVIPSDGEPAGGRGSSQRPGSPLRFGRDDKHPQALSPKP
jgi:hypothetical protein